MNNKIFIFITVVFVVAAVFISEQRAPRTTLEKSKLFPGLADSINDISEITIADSENTLTIHRVSDKWAIADGDDYPALINRVKQTVVTVAELNVLAEKTTNPQLYKRLGVEDIDAKGAASHLLTLKDNDAVLASLIVGDVRRNQSPAENPGVYVRLPDQKQALLVDGGLTVNTDMVQWIKRDIINIASDRISDIQIKRTGEATVRLYRDTAADNLVLENIPAGKEQQSEYVINPMGTLLENIYVEGVKNENSFDFSSPDSVIAVETFDGLSADIAVVNNEGIQYAGFAFSVADASTVNEENTGAEEDGGGIKPAREAEQLNALVSGWAYRLSESKMELFNKTLAELIREPGKDPEDRETN